MPPVAITWPTAADEDVVDSPREGRGLNQGIPPQLLLELVGQLLVQVAAAVELVVVLHHAGMPASGVGSRAPALLLLLQLQDPLLALLRCKQGFDADLHDGDEWHNGASDLAACQGKRSIRIKGTLP